MASVEELAELVEQLRHQLKDTEDRMQKGTTVVVHTSEDHKLKHFTETDDIEEWCEKARNHPQLKKLNTDTEKVNFILDHLHDVPKRELCLQIEKRKQQQMIYLIY